MTIRPINEQAGIGWGNVGAQSQTVKDWLDGLFTLDDQGAMSNTEYLLRRINAAAIAAADPSSGGNWFFAAQIGAGSDTYLSSSMHYTGAVAYDNSGATGNFGNCFNSLGWYPEVAGWPPVKLGISDLVVSDPGGGKVIQYTTTP